jgi:hypothetical protein
LAEDPTRIFNLTTRNVTKAFVMAALSTAALGAFAQRAALRA